MRPALLILAFYGLIYAVCSRQGATKQTEQATLERNGGWVELSAAAKPPPILNVRSADFADYFDADYFDGVKLRGSRQL